MFTPSGTGTVFVILIWNYVVSGTFWNLDCDRVPVFDCGTGTVFESLR